MIARRRLTLAASLALAMLALAPAAQADSSALETRADATLARLVDSEPDAAKLAREAKGVLIFPEIIKAGALIGGAEGEGLLLVDGAASGRYLSVAVSYGLQLGVSRFGYVMFFMDDEALKWLDDTAGWDVGVGPNVVVADASLARKLSGTTELGGVIVFFVDQKGFFAGAGIEGTKITRMD